MPPSMVAFSCILPSEIPQSHILVYMCQEQVKSHAKKHKKQLTCSVVKFLKPNFSIHMVLAWTEARRTIFLMHK